MQQYIMQYTQQGFTAYQVSNLLLCYIKKFLKFILDSFQFVFFIKQR